MVAIPEELAFGGYTPELCWANEWAKSSVYRLTAPDEPTLYLKQGPNLAGEHDRFRWCSGRLPVPEVRAFLSGDLDSMVTVGLPGSGAHDRSAEPDTAAVAEALAEAWRAVHALPVDECPFDASTDALLAAAEEAVRMGRDDVWDRELRVMRPATEVWSEIERSIPDPDRPAVVHGDACVPNAIVEGGRLTGVVDVGDLGVGDPWLDLSLCVWSMARPGNGLAHEKDRFLHAYGADPRDPRLRWFQLVRDLL